MLHPRRSREVRFITIYVLTIPVVTPFLFTLDKRKRGLDADASSIHRKGRSVHLSPAFPAVRPACCGTCPAPATGAPPHSAGVQAVPAGGSGREAGGGARVKSGSVFPLRARADGHVPSPQRHAASVGMAASRWTTKSRPLAWPLRCPLGVVGGALP